MMPRAILVTLTGALLAAAAQAACFDADKSGAREMLYAAALSKERPEVLRFARLAAELDMAIGFTCLEEHDSQ